MNQSYLLLLFIIELPLNSEWASESKSASLLSSFLVSVIVVSLFMLG